MCPLYPHYILIYFLAGSLYLLINFTYFVHSPGPLLSDNHQFVLCIMSLFLFCFLDFTCKQNHTVFVFFLTYST